MEKGEIAQNEQFHLFHIFFYAVCILKSFNSHSSVVVCSFFEFGAVSKYCIRERVNLQYKKKNKQTNTAIVVLTASTVKYFRVSVRIHQPFLQTLLVLESFESKTSFDWLNQTAYPTRSCVTIKCTKSLKIRQRIFLRMVVDYIEGRARKLDSFTAANSLMRCILGYKI